MASSAPLSGRGRVTITLRFETPDADPPLRRWLVLWFRRLALAAGVTSGTINLLIVNDERMAELHMTFSGVEGTTDVLTFDLRDDPAAAVEGDLVICLDTARREAQARGHDTRLEALLYALHGVLHLLGYDDHAPAARAKMHRAEDHLLGQVGLGPVYARAAARSRPKPESRAEAAPASSSGERARGAPGLARRAGRLRPRSDSATSPARRKPRV